MEINAYERSAAWRSPLSHWQAGDACYVTRLEQVMLDLASSAESIVKLLDALDQEPDCLEDFSHAFQIKKTMEATLAKMASHGCQVVVLLQWMEARPRMASSLPCRKKIMNRASLTLRENHEMAQYAPLLERVRANL